MEASSSSASVRILSAPKGAKAYKGGFPFVSTTYRTSAGKLKLIIMTYFCLQRDELVHMITHKNEDTRKSEIKVVVDENSFWFKAFLWRRRKVSEAMHWMEHDKDAIRFWTKAHRRVVDSLWSMIVKGVKHRGCTADLDEARRSMFQTKRSRFMKTSMAVSRTYNRSRRCKSEARSQGPDTSKTPSAGIAPG